MVLDNVSIQLGAASCIAAAYALHENGGTPGTLLYLLASHTTESSWDVGDLQVLSISLKLISVGKKLSVLFAVGDKCIARPYSPQMCTAQVFTGGSIRRCPSYSWLQIVWCQGG
jgi:hypothetical protein